MTAPTTQADGTVLVTSSWTVSATATYKLRRHGLTSDSTQQFKATQAVSTAK